MSVDLTKLLDKAKIKVFSDSNSAFLSVLLCSLDFSWNKDIPTARTNGKYLKINPDFFVGLPEKTREFLILHELWHVARAHSIRGMNMPNRTAWQYACDIVINNDLIRTGYTHIGTEPLFDMDIEPGVSEEEVYERIKDKIPDMPDDEYSDLDEPTKEEKQEIIETLIKAKEVAKNNLHGSLGGQIDSIISGLLPPKIQWKSVLHDFVSLSDNTEFSFKRRNRRFPDICLPASTRRESLGEINYYLDVSGSVTDADIERFNSELFWLMESFELERINLIQFDTQITKEEIVTSCNKPLPVVGRGGTDLDCVYHHIQKTDPEFVIIFSDLECEMMPPLPNNPKLLWVIINNFDVIPPYGKYIHIRT